MTMQCNMNTKNWVRKFSASESCCHCIPSRNGLLQVKKELFIWTEVEVGEKEQSE